MQGYIEYIQTVHAGIHTLHSGIHRVHAEIHRVHAGIHSGSTCSDTYKRIGPQLRPKTQQFKQILKVIYPQSRLNQNFKAARG